MEKLFLPILFLVRRIEMLSPLDTRMILWSSLFACVAWGMRLYLNRWLWQYRFRSEVLVAATCFAVSATFLAVMLIVLLIGTAGYTSPFPTERLY